MPESSSLKAPTTKQLFETDIDAPKSSAGLLAKEHILIPESHVFNPVLWYTNIAPALCPCSVSALSPITAKLFADLLSVAGMDRMIVADLHAATIQGFFDVPVDHVTAIPILAKYFKNKKKLLF